MSSEAEIISKSGDIDQQSSEQQQPPLSPSGKPEDQQQQAGSPQANSQKQQQHQGYNHHGQGGNNERQLTARERVRLDEIAVLEAELAELGEDSLPNARRLLELEIHRLRWGVTDVVDLLGNRRCKIRCKVLIPQDQYPGVNFVGKLLGQGGSSLKKLQEESNVKMSILGAGSMRNERKEQECLETGEAKYQHLKQTLHLQIDCLSDPAEAYFRIGHALSKVKEAMTPDPNEMAQFYHGMGPHPHMPPPAHHYGGYGPASHNPHHQQPPHHHHHHPHHMPPPPMPPHHQHPYAAGPPPPQPPQMPPPQQQQQQQQPNRGANRLSGRVSGPAGAGYNNPPIGVGNYGAQQQPSMRGGGSGGSGRVSGGRGGGGGGGGMRSSTGGGSNGNSGNGNYDGGDSVNGSKNGGNWHRGATPRGQQQQQQQQVASRSGGGSSGSGNYMQQTTAA